MPRQARIDYPGAMHHVIGRGIERKFIFKEDNQKREFHRRLADNLDRYSIQCYGWCIMGNHFHLLLQTGKTSIAEFMRAVLTGYAVYYNRKNKRVGHLFQNRYKSVLCNKDEYLMSLVRYIHLNPVKAKIISYRSLEKYSWTGHREICCQEEGLIDHKNEILSFYGKRQKEAIQGYRQFVKDGLGLDEDFEGGGLLRSGGGLANVLMRKKDDREMCDERILGNGDFVNEVYDRLGIEESNQSKIKNKDELLEQLSQYYQVKKEDILQTRAKRVREARQVYVLYANRYLGKNMTEIGKELGVCQEAASIARKKAYELEKKDQKIKGILE